MGKRGPPPGSGGRPRLGTKGAPRSDGYKRTTIGPKGRGEQVYAHRAAAGVGPVKGSKADGITIDHKNRSRGDNRPANLRKTNKKGNAANR